jgi:Zn-dependent oligopeptidase
MLDMDQLPETNPAASFGHMFGGYESQYYGYLWSSVYSDDLFSVFKQKGIMNKDVGMRYREMILAPGGTQEALEDLTNFLGRAPNDKAFLEERGFI